VRPPEDKELLPKAEHCLLWKTFPALDQGVWKNEKKI